MLTAALSAIAMLAAYAMACWSVVSRMRAGRPYRIAATGWALLTFVSVGFTYPAMRAIIVCTHKDDLLGRVGPARCAPHGYGLLAAAALAALYISAAVVFVGRPQPLHLSERHRDWHT